MASETKIKVDRLRLIEAVKTRREEAVIQHQKDMKDYDRTLEKWRKEAIRKTEEYLAGLKGDDFASVHLGIGYAPTKLRNPLDIIDRHLKMLELCPDSTVSVNSADFGSYLL